MIGLPAVYALVGALFAGYALTGLLDRANPRRWLNGLFWGLLALSFLAGERLGDVGNGLLVLGLVAAGTAGIGRGSPPATTPDERRALAARFGDRLFAPALTVPALVLLGTLLFKHVPALVDPRQATLVALAVGTLTGLALAFALLRTPERRSDAAPSFFPGVGRGPEQQRATPGFTWPQAYAGEEAKGKTAHLLTPLQEGRRLADSIGWALILPQMLAALGALFAAAGVGDEVGRLTAAALPQGSLVTTVVAYGGGMALFTVLMGNAFAAFPVLFAGIGLPLLVRHFGGSPAGVAALGMLAGFCGTLVTPMAANFNLVPAALLDLPDRWGVIRVAAPTAAAMLAVNLLLLWGFAFP